MTRTTTPGAPDPGTPPAIRAGEVARRFGGVWALRSAALTVEWGEAVALVGPNGSGKTTLLRILAGALTPTRGNVRTAGRARERDGRTARRRTALLAGDAYLYDDLTAAENLAFALRMCGRHPDAAVVAESLGAVGLDGVADRRVRGFSSGMRRRLALARVAAIAPPILLLDEPYASLDDEGSEVVDGVIDAWRTPGRAVVTATHRVRRIRPLVDRVVRLVDGRSVDVTGNGASGPAPARSRAGLTGVGR